MLAALPDLLFVFSADGTIRDFVPASHMPTLVPAPSFLGRPIGDVVPSDVAHVTLDHLQRAVETRQIQTFVYHLSPTPGDARTYEARLVPLDASSDVLAIIRDVTDQERVARALRESDLRLQLVSRALRPAIWDWDVPSGLVTRDEAGVQRLFGYAPDETGSDTAWWPERIHPEDRELVIARMDEAMESDRDTWEIVYRFVCRDGSIRWVEDLGYIGRDTSGTAVRMTGAMFDITARKRSEERTQLLAEASAVLATSLDYEATLSRVTHLAVPALADACVVDLIEPGGAARRLPIATADDSAVPIMRAIDALGSPDPYGTGINARVFRTGEPTVLPHMSEPVLNTIARSDEHLELLRQVGIRSSIIVPLVARGSVLGTLTLITTSWSGRDLDESDLAVSQDLAHRAAGAIDNARLYASERSARVEAQDAVRARDEFMSVASHELRTPVTAVKAAAQLLRRQMARGQLHEDQLGRQLETLEYAGNRLARLVEDLLDVSRLRTGQLPLRPREADLEQLLQQTVETARQEAPDRSFTLSVEQGLPTVNVDADRLEQVVANLLENAVKYSPKDSEVRVLARREGEGILVAVVDHGIGLPNDAVESIFEPFGRAPNALERHIQGLGLGLYVARQIALAHGGRLWAESPGPDQGSTFCLWLGGVF